jgi:hypothetical protein
VETPYRVVNDGKVTAKSNSFQLLKKGLAIA